MDLVYEPGTKSLYSDLGLILLGEILERVAGEALEAFAARSAPRAARHEGHALPARGPALLPRIAPTERDPWRGRLLHGEVHDENAFAMGGVAPHAGLVRHRARPGALRADAARTAACSSTSASSRARRSSGSRAARACPARAARWAGTRPARTPRPASCSRPRSFGHTGFTGTSMWIDPERQPVRHPADQPRAPDAREQRDPRGPARRGRRGGGGLAQP